jgi:CheY-like chemotaxis protein
MLRRLIGENINLIWMPGVPLWPIEIDPAQLDQILTNLTVNARDAIDDIGKLTIESSTVTFDQAYCDRHAGFSPGQYTKLTISDDGAGMDSETQKRIFEPFYTTKGLGEGTGLGLSTVYGIVKQNNGFINVYSEPGQGTTFSIYLPRIHGEAEAVGVDKPSTAQEGQGQTILLVEDDQSLLKLSEELLNELGYRVIAEDSPAAAIQIATTDNINIDLLITDVVMPGMNGKELAETLLKHRPELKVLFTSGYTANVIAHQSILDAGVNFLQKPLSLNELAKKLCEIFD